MSDKSASFHRASRRGCYIRIIGAFLRGEKALSWQSPGGALTAFELGNAPLFGAFPDRARSLPREKEFVDFNRHYRPPAVLFLLYNKRQGWRKLSPAAQKRGLLAEVCFRKGSRKNRVASFVGRGAASIGAKPRGTQRLA